MKYWLLGLLTCASVALSPASAFAAEKMDISTTNYVIDKLNNVLSKETDAKTKAGIFHRLADLYAERSRLKLLKEVEGSCQECQGAQEDQKIALAHYRKALPHIWGRDRGPVLLQMAFLQSATGERNRSRDTLSRLLREGRKQHNDEILGVALTRMGDLYFDGQDYKEAVFYYKRALVWPATPRTGYVLHRKGWAELNTGDLAAGRQSLQEILTNPKHLDLRGEGKVDESFHFDVSRDYTTFLARGKVGKREIELVNSLSPIHGRMDNLLYLAREAERVGQLDSAISTWEFLFASGEISFEDELEGLVRLFQIQIDKNNRSQAARQAERVANSWNHARCKDKERCDELRVKFRNAITRWNQIQKNRLDAHLVASYAAFLKVFPQDMEMNYWAAQVAHRISDYASGRKFYRATSLLAFKHLRAGKKDEKTSTLFEGSLLGEVEVSEQLASPELQLDSYNHYLKLNPKGSKAGEVSYQKAYTLYTLKRYEEASEIFFSVAVNPSDLSHEMRVKAADLALDARKILKDDVTIEVWALSLSTKFEERRSDYRQLARTSALNQSKAIIDGEKSSEYERMAHHLGKYDLSDAPLEDRLAFLRNRIVLAERLRRLDFVERAAGQMLSMKDIPAGEVEFATEKLIWVAEMQLNFSKAYLLLRQSVEKKKATPENEFRLGVLAELGGRSFQGHYEKFLAMAPSSPDANFIRSKLIRNTKKPMKRIVAEQRELLKSPALLADLLEWYYVQHGYHKDLQRFLENRRLRETPQIQAIAKDVFLKDFDKVAGEIERHRMQGNNDVLMQNSVAQRMELLNKVSAFAQSAIDSRDWTLQVVTLAKVAEQSARMYKDLAALPLPRGLNAEQKRQYQALLAERAEAFKEQALQSQEKLAEMWKNHGVFREFQRAYTQSEGSRRTLVRAEIDRVRQLAPPRIQLGFNRLLQHQNKRPTRNQIVAAQMDLKKDPFSVGKARRLKRLNDQYGDDIFASYMEGRIRALQKGKGES